MKAPQIIMLCLTAISLLVAAAKAGSEEKFAPFGWQLMNSAILLALLYWGGFFN